MGDLEDSLGAMEEPVGQLEADQFADETASDSGKPREDDDRENVQVMIRCKPLSGGGDAACLTNKQATTSNNKKLDGSCVRANEAERFVEIGDRRLYYDAVFGQVSSNELVFTRAASQLVEASFRGYNCTLFLYGQTGTGKTYTHAAIATNAFQQLFALIRDSNARNRFLIRAAYCEIYNEEIRDLLASYSNSSARKPLELRENKTRGVYVKDLTWFLVRSQLELERLKQRGDARRAQAATRMNQHSSRSHSILSLTVETLAEQGGSTGGQNSPPVRQGRLHLVDLAGSERQTKSGSSGLQLKEASSINLSLTCLALVIRALTDPSSSHVPYRNSKLTRLLSSSLGGNSKTVLIACISSSPTDLDESLSTLRFASRAKRIQNKATVNEDAKDALLRKYRRQIEILKLKISESTKGQPSSLLSQVTGNSSLEANAAALKEDVGPDSDGDELSRQLQLLRDKIMVGGENLLEKAEVHERLLEASRQELEQTRRAELELKQRLASKRAALELVNASRKPLEIQVSQLDEQLGRCLEVYRQSREEQRDLKKEHQQLKENLLQSIRATSRAIKYADCIIDDFIAREHLDLINSYAHYDEEGDEWQIKYVAFSGNNIAHTKRIATPHPQPDAEGPHTSSRCSSSATNGNHASKGNRQEPFIRWRDYSRECGRYKPH